MSTTVLYVYWSLIWLKFCRFYKIMPRSFIFTYLGCINQLLWNITLTKRVQRIFITCLHLVTWIYIIGAKYDLYWNNSSTCLNLFIWALKVKWMWASKNMYTFKLYANFHKTVYCGRCWFTWIFCVYKHKFRQKKKQKQKR